MQLTIINEINMVDVFRLFIRVKKLREVKTKKMDEWTNLSKLNNSSQFEVGINLPGVQHNPKIITAQRIENISELFSMIDYDSIRKVIAWFNKTYNKKLTADDYEWMSSSSTYYAEDDEDN